MTAASRSAPSPSGKGSFAAASPFLKDSPLRRTVFLLLTDQGFIADHSKKQVDDSTSLYTNRIEDALGYLDQDAAAMRAQAIADVDPSVSVTAVELFCDRGQYPYGWLEV